MTHQFGDAKAALNDWGLPVETPGAAQNADANSNSKEPRPKVKFPFTTASGISFMRWYDTLNNAQRYLFGPWSRMSAQNPFIGTIDEPHAFKYPPAVTVSFSHDDSFCLNAPYATISYKDSYVPEYSPLGQYHASVGLILSPSPPMYVDEECDYSKKTFGNVNLSAAPGYLGNLPKSGDMKVLVRAARERSAVFPRRFSLGTPLSEPAKYFFSSNDFRTVESVIIGTFVKGVDWSSSGSVGCKLYPEEKPQLIDSQGEFSPPVSRYPVPFADRGLSGDSLLDLLHSYGIRGAKRPAVTSLGEAAKPLRDRAVETFSRASNATGSFPVIREFLTKYYTYFRDVLPSGWIWADQTLDDYLSLVDSGVKSNITAYKCYYVKTVSEYTNDSGTDYTDERGKSSYEKSYDLSNVHSSNLLHSSRSRVRIEFGKTESWQGTPSYEGYNESLKSEHTSSLLEIDNFIGCAGGAIRIPNLVALKNFPNLVRDVIYIIRLTCQGSVTSTSSYRYPRDGLEVDRVKKEESNTDIDVSICVEHMVSGHPKPGDTAIDLPDYTSGGLCFSLAEQYKLLGKVGEKLGRSGEDTSKLLRSFMQESPVESIEGFVEEVKEKGIGPDVKPVLEKPSVEADFKSYDGETKTMILREYDTRVNFDLLFKVEILGCLFRVNFDYG